MTERHAMQGTGSDSKGAPDGVNDRAENAAAGPGNAYPNPHTGKKPQDGFMGHGGQTNLEDRSKSGENVD